MLRPLRRPVEGIPNEWGRLVAWCVDLLQRAEDNGYSMELMSTEDVARDIATYDSEGEQMELGILTQVVRLAWAKMRGRGSEYWRRRVAREDISPPMIDPRVSYPYSSLVARRGPDGISYKVQEVIWIREPRAMLRGSYQ